MSGVDKGGRGEKGGSVGRQWGFASTVRPSVVEVEVNGSGWVVYHRESVNVIAACFLTAIPSTAFPLYATVVSTPSSHRGNGLPHRPRV